MTLVKENLFRDRYVLGKNWNKTYKGYFSDTKVLKSFSDCVLKLNFPKNKTLNILYVCSGTGLLGEYVCLNLRNKGYKTKLTLLEVSKEQLNQNKNPKTKKICKDLLKFNSKQKYDLIIMRSSLDYFNNKKDQIKALKIIKKHLLDNGFFINQCAAFPELIERNLANNIYKSNKKIGTRHFQSLDISEIYKKSGFVNLFFIKEAPIMKLTEQEHVERYKLTFDDINKIQKLILKINSKSRPNILVTKKGYKMNFHFPIFLSIK